VTSRSLPNSLVGPDPDKLDVRRKSEYLDTRRHSSFVATKNRNPLIPELLELFYRSFARSLDERITRDNATPVRQRYRRELKRVHSIPDYSTGRADHSRWKRHVKILTLIGKHAAGEAQQSKA